MDPKLIPFFKTDFVLKKCQHFFKTDFVLKKWHHFFKTNIVLMFFQNSPILSKFSSISRDFHHFERISSISRDFPHFELISSFSRNFPYFEQILSLFRDFRWIRWISSIFFHFVCISLDFLRFVLFHVDSRPVSIVFVDFHQKFGLVCWDHSARVVLGNGRPLPISFREDR